MEADLSILQHYDRTRDPDAFTQLVARHAAMVYAAAYRVTRNAADADDVTQECFLELTRKAGEVRSSVTSWLHLTATHRAHDLRRNLGRARGLNEAADAPVAEADPMAWKEIAPILDTTLAELPEELRLPLIAHYLEGRAQSVVAQELGLSQPTISRRLEEGLRALRTKLQARGVTAGVPGMGVVLAGFCMPLPATVKTNLAKLALAGIGKTTAAAATPLSAGAAAKGSAGLLPYALVTVALGIAAAAGWMARGSPAPSQPVRTEAPSPVTAAAPAYPLKVSANGHYLVDQRGAPFLWVGDTGSEAIATLTEAEMDLYLDNRKAKGFTVIHAEMMQHQYPRNAYGELPFTGTVSPGVSDFTTPNAAYFRTADAFLRKAAERGLCVLLAYSHLGYDGGVEGWFGEMKANGRERLRTWGRWLGARYQDQGNIVWVGGGDFTPADTDQWVMDEVAEGIREGGARQPQTVHGPVDGDPAMIYGTRAWFDVEAVFSHSPALPPLFQARYARLPTRPVFLLETTFEGEHGSTPDQIRRQAYRVYLSGGCGQMFGNGQLWHFNNPQSSRPVCTWQQVMDAQGSQDMARLASALAARAWWKLVPDSGHATLTAGFRSGAEEIVAARAEDGSLVMAYVPSTGTASVGFAIAMEGLAGSVTAAWFNPATGANLPVSGSPFPNAGSRNFTTPGDNGTGSNDWLLVLTAAQSADPGTHSP